MQPYFILQILDTLNEFTVQFTGLKEGIHTFFYKVNERFFEYFEQSEVKTGDIDVKVQLDYKKNLLSFAFEITGNVDLQCDRCLDMFKQPISYKENLFVRFGDHASDITDVDDTLILAYSETKINLAQHIYEYIILSLPYRRVHPEDESGNTLCDPILLEKLRDYTKTETDNVIDPRWDQLKSILNN